MPDRPKPPDRYGLAVLGSTISLDGLLAIASAVLLGLLTRTSTRQVVSEFIAAESASVELERLSRLADQLIFVWNQSGRNGDIVDVLEDYITSSERFRGVLILNDAGDVFAGAGWQPSDISTSIDETGARIR